jgi:hypothetical protein
MSKFTIISIGIHEHSDASIDRIHLLLSLIVKFNWLMCFFLPFHWSSMNHCSMIHSLSEQMSYRMYGESLMIIFHTLIYLGFVHMHSLLTYVNIDELFSNWFVVTCLFLVFFMFSIEKTIHRVHNRKKQNTTIVKWYLISISDHCFLSQGIHCYHWCQHWSSMEYFYVQ